MKQMDPRRQELPRDGTGRYLHLRLKRFGSVNELQMKYAKETWRKHPHDAEVDVSANSRSSCRWCKEKIDKGDLRMRLWLQCHKGCKNSAYFHERCFWDYPETTKLVDGGLEELHGWKTLPKPMRAVVEKGFLSLGGSQSDPGGKDVLKRPRDVASTAAAGAAAACDGGNADNDDATGPTTTAASVGGNDKKEHAGSTTQTPTWTRKTRKRRKAN